MAPELYCSSCRSTSKNLCKCSEIWTDDLFFLFLDGLDEVWCEANGLSYYSMLRAAKIKDKVFQTASRFRVQPVTALTDSVSIRKALVSGMFQQVSTLHKKPFLVSPTYSCNKPVCTIYFIQLLILTGLSYCPLWVFMLSESKYGSLLSILHLDFE